MPLSIGDTLQRRYRVESRLGQGGMGAVYRASDSRLKLYVAVKEMTPQANLDASTLHHLRQQFEQEAIVLARLNHPHLVDVTDFFEESGNAYLVMKYIEGESLASLISREGSLPERRALSLVGELLDALAYCHSQGVLHRDIKPQNVIISSGGSAMLVDFGLVKLWDPNDPRTRTAMRGMGTPEYAPPEQYEATAGHTDDRTDIYSLGATLYHVLTGRAPPTATMRVVDPQALVPLRLLAIDVSTNTSEAVDRALALQPASRFQSAEEMRSVLLGERLVTARARRSRAVPQAPPAAPFPRRVPVWAWAGAGVALLAIVAGLTIVSGLALGLRGRPDQAPASAVVPDAPPSPLAASPTVTLIPTGAPADTTAKTPAASTPPATRIQVSLPVLLGTPVPDPLAPISPENVDQLTEMARWGKGTVNKVAYAPDGALLAVASSIGIYLYDSASLDEVRLIETGIWVASIAFSPDGDIIAAGLADKTIRLYQVSDGSPLRTLEGHTSAPRSIAFSPDGQLLASGSWDKSVRIWPVEGTSALHTLKEHEGWVNAVAFSPDGTVIASASDDTTVKLWRPSDGSLLRTIEAHDEDVASIAFSPDGTILASGGEDETIRLWQVSSGAALRSLEEHTSWVTSLAFSPDGATLISASHDRSVRLWKVSDGTPLRTLEGHTGPVLSVSVSPNGETLVSGAEDNVVRLWRLEDGSPQEVLEGHTGDLASVAFSPDGTLLATGQTDGMASLWRVSHGSPVRALGPHRREVNSVAFSPDGAYLATATWPDVILWRVDDGSLLRTLEGHGSKVESVVFSADGTLLASGSWDETARLWRVSDGSLLHTLEGHEDSVYAVAFSPDGDLVATGANDDTARLWRVSDGSLVRTLEGHRYGVETVAFSRDGTMLASGSRDNSVRVWQVADGSLMHLLEQPRSQVYGLAFSPDGALLAAGSGDNAVWLWRVLDAMVLQTLAGHTEDVNSVAFSPDGRFLGTASKDGTARLWGVVGAVAPSQAENAPTPEARVTPPAPSASLGDTWTRPADGALMVYAPAGQFPMGSDSDELDYALQLCAALNGECERDWYLPESPQHVVSLDGFWIDRTEVTNGRYGTCVDAGACDPPALAGSYQRDPYYGDSVYADYPVMNLTWGQAAAYCEWAGGRLPSEAEWEYAARGPEGLVFPWGNTFDGAQLNYCDVQCGSSNPGFEHADSTVDDGHVDTAPVGSYPGGASWCGALDLAGNVSEWVADWYADEYYGSAPSQNPAGPASGRFRVVRGASWVGSAVSARSANRASQGPEATGLNILGFRCAKDAD